jgi:uncharacterized protein (TIGR00661 family)
MNISTIRQEKILFACNDWGLGHVSRSIGIIRQLIVQENKIYFAGNNLQQSILKEYFEKIKCLDLEGYNFTFFGNNKWGLEILSNSNNLQKGIKNEYKKVSKWCEEFNVTLIISDHRYGFRHKTITSIFITHQVNLPVTGIQKIGNYWHSKQLKKFNSIWIMDDEDHKYAGKLSSPSPKITVSYIGIYSRFQSKPTKNENYILAVISGPEPYAEQLFRKVIEIAKKSNETIKCISSKKYKTDFLPANLELLENISWKEKDELFYHCKSIISRSGYSTIMDLAILKKPFLLIPTKGQKEQEYLAVFHKVNTFVKN